MLQAITNPSPLVSSIISAMITPAILILATGNLIGTSMMLHGRILDRARVLLQRHAELRKTDADRAAFAASQIQLLRQRLKYSERAIAAYYLGVGFFIAASLAIAVTTELRWVPHQAPTMLTVVGVLFLLYGSIVTFLETRLSNRAIDREIESGFF